MMLAVSTIWIVSALLVISVKSSCVDGRDGNCCETNPKPPHILFILADDLGFNDISWNNAGVRTPYLDALAKDGIILDRNYMQNTCSPSRGSLMTGKYPFRIGLQHMSLDSGAPACLSRQEKLLPEYLKDVGYRTHLVGKWNLGFSEWECTPTYRGFDGFYGFYSPFLDHYTHEYIDGYDWRDGVNADTVNNGTYAQDLLTVRAKEVIRDHDCDVPLFMLLSSSSPHFPWQVPPGVESTTSGTPDATREDYLAMITHLDTAVEEVVNALKYKGLYDNSIIIFSSDNGAQWGPPSNHPLRGDKASIYEGGTRVPAMVHSPLMNASVRGTVSEEMIHVVDWLPTILSMAGSSAHLTHIDGVDQSQMILDAAASGRTEFVYNIDQYEPQSFGAGAIRAGDYKLIVGFPGMYDGWEDTPPGTCMTHQLALLTGDTPPTECRYESYVDGLDGSTAYVKRVANHVMLFNVIEDPSERVNLADELPDIVETMRARLDALRSEAAEVDFNLFVKVPEAGPDYSGGIWSPKSSTSSANVVSTLIYCPGFTLFLFIVFSYQH